MAQQLATNFKRTTWTAVLRGAHYLVATAGEMVLRFTPPADAGGWLASSDSSCVNAVDAEEKLAGSFHGWSLHYSGSGPFDWGCGVARNLALASGQAELRGMTVVAKAAVAMRMLARELRLEPSGPTRLLGDSKAAFEGALLERMPAKERFMAAARGLLRLWITHKVIAFVKVPKSVLRPDIFTKSTFTQLEFARLAYWVVRGQPRDDDAERLALVL